MKNADMPAMPCQPKDAQGAPCSEMTYGMTKREYFASHAPEVPDWFAFKFDAPRPIEPKPPGPYHGLTSDEIQKRPEVREHVRASDQYKDNLIQWSQQRDMAEMVAWRYVYADAMLADDRAPR